MLKDLHTIAGKIKPLSELIDHFDKLYHFEQKPKKVTKAAKKAKIELIQLPIETEQLDISPSILSFSDSDEDDVKVKPKTKKIKANKKDRADKAKPEKSPIQTTIKVDYGPIGWSDDE